MLQLDSLDHVFHALVDPGRRSMIDRLSHGPASVSDLARPLDMTLTAVLQHVKVLEAAGLITSAKTGRVRTCELELVALGNGAAWIMERRRTWETRLDRLGRVLSASVDES